MQDMQVSIEATGALERCLTVKIPEARIAGEVASRLTTLSRSAKIQGFRPGKAPMKLVQRLYGDRVRQEIIAEVIRSSFTEAIKENGLQLASQASIEPLDSESDQGFTYKATFIHSAELKADAAKVRSVIGALAANYEDPAKMIKWYYEDPKRLQEVEAIVLEEEAVEWVLAQVHVELRP